MQLCDSRNDISLMIFYSWLLIIFPRLLIIFYFSFLKIIKLNELYSFRETSSHRAFTISRLIGTVREKHIPNQRFSGYVNNKRIEGRIVIKQLT